MAACAVTFPDASNGVFWLRNADVRETDVSSSSPSLLDKSQVSPAGECRLQREGLVGVEGRSNGFNRTPTGCQGHVPRPSGGEPLGFLVGVDVAQMGELSGGKRRFTCSVWAGDEPEPGLVGCFSYDNGSTTVSDPSSAITTWKRRPSDSSLMRTSEFACSRK